MGNIIAFPGTQLPDKYFNYGFTTDEVCFSVCANLAIQITERTMFVHSQFATGITDAGEGWLDIGYLVHRHGGWVDLVPLAHFQKFTQPTLEKTLGNQDTTITGKFFMSSRQFGKDEIEAPDLQTLYKRRMLSHTFRVAKVLYMHHQANSEQIYTEIVEYPERVSTTDVVHPDKLQTIDYSFIGRLYSDIRETQITTVDDIITENYLNEREIYRGG